MAPTGIVEDVLKSHSQHLLENELYHHVENLGSPELVISGQDVGYAEYHDENEEIVFFSADIFFDEPRAEPRWREGRIMARVNGQANKNGDDWDIGSIEVDEVTIN